VNFWGKSGVSFWGGGRCVPPYHGAQVPGSESPWERKFHNSSTATGQESSFCWSATILRRKKRKKQ